MAQYVYFLCPMRHGKINFLLHAYVCVEDYYSMCVDEQYAIKTLGYRICTDHYCLSEHMGVHPRVRP